MTVHSHHSVAQARVSGGKSLRRSQHDDILGLLMLLVALVLCLAPMALQDGPKDAQINEVIVGTIVLFAAGSRLYRGADMRSDVIILLCGAWLVASPFVLGLQKTAFTDSNRVYDVVLGAALIVLALVGMALLRAAKRSETGGPTEQLPAHRVAPSPDRTAPPRP
ncbi:SPW repeat protein [Streptomyces sp. NPDC058279]|uniref:SPW repeat domain-containing protein n=1 Tax=Streptomyces sp. NPDC058279 TaxID=3346418 RepID=UPI0036E28FAC